MFVELDSSRYFCRLNVLRKVPLAPLLMDECSISNGPGAPAKIFLIILCYYTILSHDGYGRTVTLPV
jgi:hypothetical protein